MSHAALVRRAPPQAGNLPPLLQGHGGKAATKFTSDAGGFGLGFLLFRGHGFTSRFVQ
jgi:hypothetical protein